MTGCRNGHEPEFRNANGVCSKCAAFYAYTRRQRRRNRVGANTAKASPTHARNSN